MKKLLLTLLIILIAASAFGQEASAPSHQYKAAVIINPLGLLLGTLVLGVTDITVDVQFALSKSLALGIEPELAIGSVSGFGAWGGVLFFPFGNALQGMFIKLYGGAFSFDSDLYPSALVSVGFQNIWGGFVFSPSIGLKYAGSLMFDWKLNIGFAF